MFCPVTQTNYRHFKKACEHERILGSKCLTALRSFGSNIPDHTFWIWQTADVPSSAALYLQNGVLIISSDNQLSATEITDFVRSHQVHEIDTNKELCSGIASMLGGTMESSVFMKYTGEPFTTGTIEPQAATSLDDVYDILLQSHEYYRTHLNFTEWSDNYRRLLSQNLCELYEFKVDGKAVATGSIASEDDHAGVLAAIAVIPPYRNTGIGSAVTRFLTNRVLQKGKTPMLLAGYDAVAELYRRLGYVDNGSWGELYL